MTSERFTSPVPITDAEIRVAEHAQETPHDTVAPRLLKEAFCNFAGTVVFFGGLVGVISSERVEGIFTRLDEFAAPSHPDER
jgi:hypothetical protein